LHWRFTFGSFVSVVLLFCHPVTFGIYTIMACGIGLTTWLRERRLSLRATMFALEGLPALVVFLAMPRVVSSLGQTEGTQYWYYDYPFVLSKLIGIAKSLTSASMAGDVACIVGLIGVVAVCIVGRARMQVALLPGVVGLCLLYVLLPDVLGPTAYVDKRLPFVGALLGLATLDLRIRSRSLFAATVAILVVSIAAKQASIAVMWRSFDGHHATFEAMLSYRGRQPPLTHLAALASLDDTRFVASNFAIPGQQPIAVREEYVGYYELQKSIQFTCVNDDHAARELSRRIRQVAEEARLSAPVYLLLLRHGTVEPVDAALLAKGSNYALYRLAL
jgi:hypothetical protein